MNTIQPIVPIESIESLHQAEKTSAATENTGSVAIPFQSLFEDAIENVKETSAVLDSEITKLATGQTDDLHAALIASQKATLSVNMVVQLRNKLLDAYKEISNISV
ncbi:MAG: Flagellar hook-basal body complex protein FliE [Thermocaproicibacter melissae]|jgi:flagellar hook-basal body complex protein FliE|uniref:flagellar hook-basal body complex protein FliE n=1 Tax=Thermocaproicibacter melissae TaxID=2966552 RepID=UPI0024B137AB|nr:flagellar hook-basal body complex protein FliE [Thermocaproicibacter melissae]WBY64314.1 flagellar hook-basal body complex protein FliE [Thermocaproicibacter melissae]